LPRSRETIWQFLDAAPHAIRLFDINLRRDYYDREAIVEGCRRATLLKLNNEELGMLAELLELPPDSPRNQLESIRHRFGLEAVVYTRGKRGTLLVLRDVVADPPPAHYPAAPGADAVGAGDACSAGILVGFLLRLSPEQTGELANHLGAYVASQPGATPELPSELISRAG
jgi:fructokinase